MMKRVLFLIVLAAVVAGSVPSKAVAAKTIVGRIAEVTDRSLQTTDREIMPITLDSRTRYMKWITQKPWQESTEASARDLKVGRLVAVELRKGEQNVAGLVRIATDQLNTEHG